MEEDEGDDEDDGRFASLTEELVLWNFELELAGIWVLTGGMIVVATVVSFFCERSVVGLVERNSSSMIESVLENSGSICAKLKSVPKSIE